MIEEMGGDSAVRNSVDGAVRRALKLVWYSVFRHHPYHYLGAVLWKLMPGDDGQRMQRVFEQSNRRPLPIRTLALLHYLDNWYYSTYSNAAALPTPNRLRWSGALAVESHLEALRNYERDPSRFEKDYGSLLQLVQEWLREDDYESVVEIGCGNGLLIERVAAQAPGSQATFMGLDMSAEILALNRQRYAGSRVQYHASESLQAFLAREPRRSVVVLAVGTIQLFTEEEFLACLRWITTNVPRGALAVWDFTFAEADRQEHSRPAGNFTFFHNYESLFVRGGLRDVRSRVEADHEPRWKNVLVSGRWGGC